MKGLLRFILFATIAVVLVLVLRNESLGLLGVAKDSSDQSASYSVQRRTVDDRVVERGTIESQNTVYGNCEIPGGSKITFIVPEGTKVKKGDKVVALETDKVDADINETEVKLNEAKGKLAEAEQALEIKKNESAANIAAAKLAYDIAKIDRIKYEQGDFLAERADLERAIKEAEAELEKVRDERNNIEILVKKGYRTPQQLREYQSRENQYLFAVERDKQKLKVLVTYDREKKSIELGGKEEEARLKLESATNTAKAETIKAEGAIENAKRAVEIIQQQLAEHQRLKEKCTLFASQDGTVAYANEPWYDASERIREGTEVYSGRGIFYLPDMSRMQVKANVHESVIDRIKPGQKATIRLDAFSDRKLNGTIASVAGMAASSYSNVQNYETIIQIDELPPDLSIKPGMTAEVDMLVGTYTDIIAVPVGAVTEHFGQSYVYVLNNESAQRRKVLVGRMTHSFVEITEGLDVGETVALDAYQRGVSDFAKSESELNEARPPANPTMGTP